MLYFMHVYSVYDILVNIDSSTALECKLSLLLMAILFNLVKSLILTRLPVSVGTQEDCPRSHGPSVKSRLYSARCHLHEGLLAPTRHRHITHQTFRHRGKSCIKSLQKTAV